MKLRVAAAGVEIACAEGVTGGRAAAGGFPRRRGARILMLLIVITACRSAPTTLPAVDDPSFDAAIVAHQAALASRDEPTPAKPRLGCIAPTMRQQSQTEGRLMPEVVRVIGTYPNQDSHGRAQLKILRAGEFNLDKWQPWPKDEIRFSGCGKEFDALSLMDALRAEPVGRH